MAMTRILVIKVGALGDVLRTTSILPGLRSRFGTTEITWVTAPAARDLVAHHPLVDQAIAVDTRDAVELDALGARLASANTWDWVLSFDDEIELCRLASLVPAARLSGATLGADRETREYTDDVSPWFEMGLLSRDGKELADRRKRENSRSHPEIFASMLGVSMGRPELPVSASQLAWAEQQLQPVLGPDRRPVIGLNTGSGGRWPSKGLPVERVVEVITELRAARSGRVSFVLFGGPEERDRNADIVAAVRALGADGPTMIDVGVDNSILEFAALASKCDLLVTSDSLGLHVGVARHVPIVAFFAPTSAAEIDLYGQGEKVVSTAADYCSYRRDADNSTITTARLVAAVERCLVSAPANS